MRFFSDHDGPLLDDARRIVEHLNLAFGEFLHHSVGISLEPPDEHNANLIMTMPQFDEKWNIVYNSLKMDIDIL